MIAISLELDTFMLSTLDIVSYRENLWYLSQKNVSKMLDIILFKT